MVADSTTGPEGDIGKSVPASFFKNKLCLKFAKHA